MSYNGGIITPPVSIRDVQLALGTTENDLGRLCVHSSINKWAKFKPVIKNKKERLTYSDLAGTKFGLVPKQNDLLKTKGDSTASGTSMIQSGTDLENVLNANAQWDYNRPTGGAASPFRITDFTQPADNDLGYGYYKDTPPPIEDVASWNLKLKRIRECAADTGITKTVSDASPYGWKLEDGKRSEIFHSLKFRFGGSTDANIGNADTRAIPLHELLGVTDNENIEYWRLAVAVQVPSGASFSYMRFFMSRYTFIDAQKVTDGTPIPNLVLPSLGTNQYLCQLIDNYATYLRGLGTSGDILGNRKLTVQNPTFRLPACLCLIQNAYLGGQSRDGGGVEYRSVHLTADSVVYSAPSLYSRFDIVVTDNYYFNEDEVTAYNLATISHVVTDKYTQFGTDSPGRVYIHRLTFRQNEAAPANTTIWYRVECMIVTGRDSQGLITENRIFSGSVALSTSGDSLVVMDIGGGPGLTVKSIKQSTKQI